MLSLLKKVSRKFKTERCVIEDFVHSRAHILKERSPKEETVPHLPGQVDPKENQVLTYKITQEECNRLKEELSPGASTIEEEGNHSLFGHMPHKEKCFGFYLGKSYQHNTYWARFWVK